jgi:hypothetical protein
MKGQLTAEDAESAQNTHRAALPPDVRKGSAFPVE